MGKAIEITRLDRSAAELRELDGWSRGEAATASGMDRQTLCDWVHRYNSGDVEGLATAPRCGRPSALSEAQMAELKELVIKGPDPEKDGVVRWRCVDLRAKIAARFAVTFHKRSVAKLLGKLGLTRLQPRPYHPKKASSLSRVGRNVLPLLVYLTLPTW